jgi:hypothetical protein
VCCCSTCKGTHGTRFTSDAALRINPSLLQPIHQTALPFLLLHVLHCQWQNLRSCMAQIWLVFLIVTAKEAEHRRRTKVKLL